MHTRASYLFPKFYCNDFRGLTKLTSRIHPRSTWKGFASFGYNTYRECTRTRLRVYDVSRLEFDKRVTYNDTTRRRRRDARRFAFVSVKPLAVEKRGGIRRYFVVDVIPSRACHINNRLARPRHGPPIRGAHVPETKEKKGNLRDCDSLPRIIRQRGL